MIVSAIYERILLGRIFITCKATGMQVYSIIYFGPQVTYKPLQTQPFKG